jgi:hypothetical protein
MRGAGAFVRVYPGGASLLQAKSDLGMRAETDLTRKATRP